MQSHTASQNKLDRDWSSCFISSQKGFQPDKSGWIQ